MFSGIHSEGFYGWHARSSRDRTCPDHGKFLIRVRISDREDGTVRVSRLTYEADSQAAEAYARRADKAQPEAPRPRRRRYRRRSGEKTSK